MTARRTLTIAGAVATTAILAACSGSPGTAASSSPVTSPGGTSTSSPTAVATSQPTPGVLAPKATEVNPSGDIPDNALYVPFSPAPGGYSVKVPEGWARTASGASAAFSDKLNHIEVSLTAAPNKPSIASVASTDAASLKTSVPKYAMGKASTVVRQAGTAILLTYQGDSTPDEVTGKVVRDAFERYTFYRAGRRIDLTLSGPTTADNVDPWKIVSDSLRWK